MSWKEDILTHLKSHNGQTDHEIAISIREVPVTHQTINVTCRDLVSKGLIVRRRRPEGFIGNYLSDRVAEEPILPQEKLTPSSLSASATQEGLRPFVSEDFIKQTIDTWLVSQGWKSILAMGHVHGIDIDAYQDKQRWIIEAKGEGSRSEMRVNYFIGILGETLQRMSDPNAKYSIALPDIKQFRNLWERLPRLAKGRTGITALFVSHTGNVTELT